MLISKYQHPCLLSILILKVFKIITSWNRFYKIIVLIIRLVSDENVTERKFSCQRSVIANS